MDPDYDTFLPATYSMPSGYVRYAIKMPDEVDLIADYLCDCDDEVGGHIPCCISFSDPVGCT